ncbi:MAG TPA: carboxypeptidase regulatory-like domain-containing protein [Terriglobia bacterium]|nr:carboxypeptidase regulatory-like domain-containing protein [Terriglobia bacterium]
MYWVVFILAGAALAQAPRGQTGLIEGRVANAVTGLGIRDVMVRLQSESEDYSITAVSGENGSFTFLEVPAGNYRISGSREGFYSPRTPPAHVSVANQQALKDVGIRLISLARVSGRVFGEDRKPRSDALVSVLRVQYSDGTPWLTPVRSDMNQTSIRDFEVSTNEDGSFTVEGLEDGEYYLVVKTPRVPLVFYPGVSSSTLAVPIVVQPGKDVFGIRFDLPVPDLHVVNFDVVMSDNSGTLGKPLLCSVIQVSDQFYAVVADKESLTSHNDGRWSISPGLSTGSYRVLCTPRPLLYGTTIGLLHVDVTNSDVEAGQMIVSGNVAVRGRIDVSNSDIGAVNYKELRLFLIPDSGWPITLTPGLAAGRPVANDGTFTFRMGEVENVPPGKYQVRLTGLPPNAYIEEIRYDHKTIADGRLQIDRAGDLVLRISGPGAVIKGIVRDARGLPQGNVPVLLLPSMDQRGNHSLFKEVLTDTDGGFVIRGIRRGEYGLISWTKAKAGAHLNSRFMEQFESRVIKVSVPGSSEFIVNPTLVEN